MGSFLTGTCFRGYRACLGTCNHDRQLKSAIIPLGSTATVSCLGQMSCHVQCSYLRGLPPTLVHATKTSFHRTCFGKISFSLIYSCLRNVATATEVVFDLKKKSMECIEAEWSAFSFLLRSDRLHLLHIHVRVIHKHRLVSTYFHLQLR